MRGGLHSSVNVFSAGLLLVHRHVWFIPGVLLQTCTLLPVELRGRDRVQLVTPVIAGRHLVIRSPPLPFTLITRGSPRTSGHVGHQGLSVSRGLYSACLNGLILRTLLCTSLTSGGRNIYSGCAFEKVVSVVGEMNVDHMYIEDCTAEIPAIP